jgi:NDP-sugar pyrophosphorylase family protein
MRLIRPVPLDPFIVSNADLISNIDFAALLGFHNSQHSEVTMAIRTHQWQNPFGVVEIDDGQVNKIVEKPIINSNISAGIYVFNPTAINSLKENEYCDMPTLIQRLIEEKRRISAFPVHEEWLDIGHEKELGSEQSLP